MLYLCLDRASKLYNLKVKVVDQLTYKRRTLCTDWYRCLMRIPQFSFWQFSIIIVSCIVLPTANTDSAFVRPGNTSVTCSSSQQPCLTFNEYAQQVDQYFVDNTTFLFLSGTHELDIQLELEDLSNISFVPLGEVNNAINIVQILLNQLVNITWINCDNIELSGLVFVLSGQRINFISYYVFDLLPELILYKTTGYLTNLTVIGNGNRLFAFCIYSYTQISNLNVTRIKARTLYAYDSTTDFYGQNIFHSNDVSIVTDVGYILAFQNCHCNFSGSILFVSNTRATVAVYGKSHTTISGNLSFLNNTINSTYNYALQNAMDLSGGTIVISGNVSFINNTAPVGGSQIHLYDGATCYIHGYISFLQNEIGDTISIYINHGGTAIFIDNSTLSISGIATFIHNRAMGYGVGGAICAFDQSRITFEESSDVLFIENFVKFDYGGAIYVVNANLSMYGRVLFERNSAGTGGGAIAIEANQYELAVMKCSGRTIIFQNNTSNDGGTILAISYIQTVIEYGYRAIVELRDTQFEGNSAKYDGRAIYVGDSSINMTGTVYFVKNSARSGGAMAIYGKSFSKLLLTGPLTAYFVGNSASRSGGVIFYEDDISIIYRQCSLPDQTPLCFIELISSTNISLFFDNNNANYSGRLFYGINFECMLSTLNDGHYSYSYYPLSTIASISNVNVNVSNYKDNTTSNVSSDPLQVCICKSYDLECNYTEIETVRGREFTLPVVIVGQGLGAIPSTVRISLGNDALLGSPVHHIQSTGKICTNISYRLFAESNTTFAILFPDDGPCRDNYPFTINIRFKFLPCPNGFIKNGPECACEERLQRFNAHCNVDTSSIQWTTNVFWMGILHGDNFTYEGLILHAGCPLDYCINTPVPITLDNLNIQCNYNHSGTLCGSCKEGYSIALGTLHCLPCSNDYLTLILPFALAGIALVAILLLLRLTITAGTLQGFIFYVNVIQTNRSFFFPAGETNILTVFIAWFNLDVGIETCFYDGITMYAYTWLQFVFPFYIWFLIGLIIMMSHYSSKMTKILGNNPVAALATLFLLSYSKILGTIITAITVTELEYPNNESRMEWLYDGNVAYGRNSHLILVIFAILILVFLFIPYTLLLFFAHWLQALSHWRILSWLNKIKPFMDTYHAPYKKQTRYWTGLLLFVRLILFIFTAIHSELIPIAITSIMVVLLALAWINMHGIYENHWNNILEAFFITNLCTFAAITYYKQTNELIQVGTANFFVGFAFTAFICIVLFHIYMVLRETAAWKKIPRPNVKKYFIRKKN